MVANLAIVRKDAPPIPPAAAEIFEVPLPGQDQMCFTPAPDGLPVFHGKTYEDHLEAWTHLDDSIKNRQWAQAAIASSLETKYGDGGMKHLATDIGRGKTWLYDMARAYRKFQDSSRLEFLTFTHHVEAAKDDDPIGTLHKANDGGWSTREVKGYVETGIEPEPKSAKRTEPKDPAFALALAKLHDDAVRGELADKAGVIRPWIDQAVDPLLAAVYRRLAAILDWQRNRTVETDCAAIMEIFAEEEGMELPDCVSKTYIAAWLNLRGRLIGKADLADRIDTLKKMEMLTDYSRKKSKGTVQRGAVPPVYAPCPAYMAKLEDFAFISNTADRQWAIHKDWIERAIRCWAR